MSNIEAINNFLDTLECKPNDWRYYNTKKQELSKICGWDSDLFTIRLYERTLNKMLKIISGEDARK